MMIFLGKLKEVMADRKKRKMILAGFVICFVVVIALVQVFSDGDDAGEIIVGDTALQDDSSGDEDGSGDENAAAEAEKATKSSAVIMVDVGGAVNTPTVVAMSEGSRVVDAIELAGGLRDDANVQTINQAQVLEDGQKIYIPTNDEVASGLEKARGAGTTGSGTGMTGYDGGVSGGDVNSDKININSSDGAALQQITGVGPATAQKIIDYRTSNGKFAKIEDIMNVSGIGQKTFEKMKEHICV
ncbi:MAG: helix-hairpin-helix domain-containing protein [Clostridiales Family XIII bacterium]|jgi:competence protein ComEA|nr:helix-hairpin-helix domain-containing protein [Clostridiales Family XIII bacterium]